MGKMTCETARNLPVTAEDQARRYFGDRIAGGNTDAVFLDAVRSRVLGVCGMDTYMPACTELINNDEVRKILTETDCSVLIDVSGEVPEVYAAPADRSGSECITENTASGELLKQAVCSTLERLRRSPGEFNEKGELILDLKAQKVGLHYPVNLLLGDRSSFSYPLITTPKSSVDALGRGSFRAAGGDQVLATRYVLEPEENGEPANRQFYLFEDGKQIFWSADVRNNVESAVCCHSQNRTVITYTTEDGLRITRTIFILPQEEGMPEAVEAQRITIENLTGKSRSIRLVATGVFGIQGPDTIAQDIVYANLVAEGAVLSDEDVPFALTLNSKPAADRAKKRFAMMLSEGRTMEEYCTSQSEFIGSGSLERPEHAGWLSCTLHRKMAPFFAMAQTIVLPADGTVTTDVFAGMCYAGDISKASDPKAMEEAFKADPVKVRAEEEAAEERIYNLYRKYSDPEKLGAVLDSMEQAWDEYSSYLIPETEDEQFNSYVKNDLPFQVLYQTYVSRAFAWTQKAYRETGFREIQDIFASMYYLCANGQQDLVRKLIASWIENVWEMGYAYHNFTFRGKEPGDCSDDQLWLLQAVYRYVHLTGDTEFLRQEFPVAGKTEADGTQSKRSLWETIRAILTYSGKISVGKHGLPLLDKADWNDTLRLDHGVMQGPAKEELYYKQLEEKGQEYGAPLENEQSESIMNAFLLKIAADETAELAVMLGDGDMERFARTIADDVTASCRQNAWMGDYYARCLINDGREFRYLGAAGDGLSADPDVDGSYFLNSYSWAILAGVADEDQIRTMLEQVNKYLRTDAGLKLCTLIAYEKLGVNTGTAFYFPGDRENCGVFKHAAMMAAVASMQAAKTVSNSGLADDLRELAFFMMDKTMPYRTLDDPFVLKGNPRFCTQYNNSETGENIGPMLSGTASWLTLGVYEHFGLDVRKDEIEFRPLLRPGADSLKYTVDLGDAVLHVSITGRDGHFRAENGTGYTAACEGKTEIFDGTMKRPHSGEWNIDIRL